MWFYKQKGYVKSKFYNTVLKVRDCRNFILFKTSKGLSSGRTRIHFPWTKIWDR